MNVEQLIKQANTNIARVKGQGYSPNYREVQVEVDRIIVKNAALDYGKLFNDNKYAVMGFIDGVKWLKERKNLFNSSLNDGDN